MWPKFDDQSIGVKLAITGAIKDDILNITDLSLELIEFLKNKYPGKLNARYGVDENQDKVKLLYDIADARKCLGKDGEADTEKAAGIIIDDLRKTSIGRITLDRIEDYE